MSLWAMLAARLLAGNDLAAMSAETKEILMNKEVIAIDQDSLGKQGDRYQAEAQLEVWSRPLANGDKAIALFNRGRIPLTMTVDLRGLGYTDAVQLRDLWQHKDLGSFKGSYEALLVPHGVVLLRAHSGK